MPSSSIDIRNGKHASFELDREVFFMLFNHTIVRRNTKLDDALQSGSMRLDDFIHLTRMAEVPYPLFFLSKSQAQGMIDDYEKRVYFGVSKQQISIASRGNIELADISLILKDITRKQGYIKGFIKDENSMSGSLKKSGKSITDQAEAIRQIIGFSVQDIEKLNKEKTFERLASLLAVHNIFVSLYTDHYTPQRIEKSLKFSGIVVNDKKCPFLFIKAGDNDSAIEPWGRRLLTVALLISAMCHGDYGPVTMEGKCRDLTELSDKHYLFAEEFLMPSTMFEKESIVSRADIDGLSIKYSVSPSALVMRARRLNIIHDDDTKNEYLNQLQEEWDKVLSRKGGGNQIAPEKAINRYNNSAVVGIILESYRSGQITAEAAKNLLCYKKGEKLSISGLDNHGK